MSRGHPFTELYGHNHGNSNTALGHYAGNNSRLGNGNVFIGFNAGYSETGSNKLYISNSSTSTPLIYGDFAAKQIGLSTNVLTGALNFPAGTTAAGGIYFGTDTNLYGLAAGSLKTDGLFTAGNGLVIGSGGTQIKKFLSATVSWTPPSVNTGSATTTTVPVTNAAVGDTVTVSFSQPLPDNVLMTGSVSAAGTVKVVLFNASGATVSLSAGTLRADVWQH